MSAAAILDGLTRVAHDALWLAILWHLALALVLVQLARGWRPPERLAVRLLALPLASVSLVAWLAGNPFNGAVYAILALALVWASRASRTAPVARGPAWSAVAGALLLAYGWLYPHFLADRSPLIYLVAAPVGVVPCATLSVVIGFTLLGGGLGARAGSLLLAAAGAFYGLTGVAQLGVLLDVGLLAGALLLAGLVLQTGARAGRQHPGGGEPVMDLRSSQAR